MKITDVKTHMFDCYRTNWVFVEINTDAGITGMGEATLEFCEHALVGAIEDMKPRLIGRDPANIEEICHILARDTYWKIGPVITSAVSGIELALWDILGKSLGVPVYTLMGGKTRDSVKIYANGWFAGAKKPEEFAAKAAEAVKLGVTALKFDPFGSAYMNISNAELDLALKKLWAVKEAVPASTEILVEGHGRFCRNSAINIAKELEELKPKFFEEPVPPDSIEELGEVTKKARVPIAAGERLYRCAAFFDLLNRTGVEFIQPDPSHAGGISELKKISAMAEAKHVSFAPHNPSGPGATAAALTLAACCHNFEILEIMLTDVPRRKKITDERLVFSNGNIVIPSKPGLGLEYDISEIEKYPYRQRFLRHYNGELTDIRPTSPEENILYFDFE